MCTWDRTWAIEISVVDGATETALPDITLGEGPVLVDVDPTTARVFVGLRESQSVGIIDGNTDTFLDPMLSINGIPASVSVNTIDHCAYVGVSGQNSLFKVCSGTPTTYPLNVAKTGTGIGTVTSNPAGINCGADCSEMYSSGISVTLKASADAGSTFTGWGGACSGSGDCTVTMDATKNVAASFFLNRYALTVTRTGTGTGTVTSNPAGVNCGTDCSESYSFGTVVTLTANPASGSTFAGWSGACGGTGACQVTMTAAQSVTASFTLNPALTVTRTGTGTGTVTSTPSGINCGAVCSASYPSGTAVTLIAAAAVRGSRFSGWSGGGCSGTSNCVVTLNADTTTTATFLGYSDAISISGQVTVTDNTGSRQPLSGVTITVSTVSNGAGEKFVTTTDSSGKYTFGGLTELRFPDGYKLTPFKSGYGFSPISRSVNLYPRGPNGPMSKDFKDINFLSQQTILCLRSSG